MPEDFPEDDGRDDDGEGFEDLDYDEDDTDLAVCPHCGAEVYDDVDRCPECGQNIVRGSDAGGRRPASGPGWPIWVILTAAVLAVAIALYCLTASGL
jgi:predicted RNA-binding Zn-ribbon protein involved in translation (DUF1610 family)